MPIRVQRRASTTIFDDVSSSVVRHQSDQTVNLDIFNELSTKKIRLAAATAGPPLVPASQAVDMSMFTVNAGDEARGFVFEFDRACELILNFNDVDGPRTIPCIPPGAPGTIGRIEMDCSPTTMTVQNSDATAPLNATIAVWGAETPA